MSSRGTGLPKEDNTGDGGPPAGLPAYCTPVSNDRKRFKLSRELSMLENFPGTGGRKRTVLANESPWTTLASPEDVTAVKKEFLCCEKKECHMVPPDTKKKKTPCPPPTRSIIDNRSLQDLVQKNTVCKRCQGAVVLKFNNPKNSGIAVLPTMPAKNALTQRQGKFQLPIFRKTTKEGEYPNRITQSMLSLS